MFKEIVSPVLDRFDSERTHVLTREALYVAEAMPGGLKVLEYVSNGGRRFADERLRVQIGGKGTTGCLLDNPLIVGAGWDKIGCTVLVFAHMGFAGITVGTVLPDVQEGNPKPRQFMLAPGVAWNHLGFNTPGMGRVMRNLSRYRSQRGYVTQYWASHQPQSIEPMRIGVSVGRNRGTENKDAAQEHYAVIKQLYHVADYFEHGVSSPNSPNIRRLQEKEYLIDVIQAGNSAMDRCGARRPVFVKSSPDISLDAAMEMARVVIENGATGIIFGNSTNNAAIKGKYGGQWRERGGLSGDDPEFRALSTRLIRHVYRETKGVITLIGAGGVKDTETALEKIMAGASALQIVTAIRGEGPRVAPNINRGLAAYMEEEGVKRISDLVGVAA